MLDMFKRPGDAEEHNYLYGIPTAALVGLYGLGYVAGFPEARPARLYLHCDPNVSPSISNHVLAAQMAVHSDLMLQRWLGASHTPCGGPLESA
jgi:hypothetical protein